MRPRFQDSAVHQLAAELIGHPRELAPLIHASRLIGSDPGLVLHGGGNTSAKALRDNIFGKKENILYVKGSGIDMAAIGPEGFSVLLLDPVRRLREIPNPPDEVIENHLAIQRVIASGPNPSVETLLHAFLPHRFVFHCHADAVLILTLQKRAKALICSVLGEGVAVLPYVHPGLPLARAAVEAYEKNPEIDAIIVLHHGIFVFAEDAGHAYHRMLALVKKAEFFIQEALKKSSRTSRATQTAFPPKPGRETSRVAQIIRGICAGRTQGGAFLRRLVVSRQNPELIEASRFPGARKIFSSGVLTPDHAIRTRNRMVYLSSVPEKDNALKKVLGSKVAAFEKDYARYLLGKKPGAKTDSLPKSVTPVLFLVEGVGLFAVGETFDAARIAADIGERTVIAKWKAFALGQCRPIPASHVREMELWPLQTKKLKPHHKAPLTGQVAVVTGGGGAIGYGIARSLLAAGAATAIADIDTARLAHSMDLLTREFGFDRVFSVNFDVTDLAAVEKGFETVSVQFGGCDLVVPNAGIAHVARIEDLDPDKLDQVVGVNLKGTFTTIKAAIPIFRRQGTGGNIVVISSKNVFDPGAAFSAYSASKAAAHQMAKIAAMELSELGVRVNMINPDAVFGDENVGSGLWELVGPERMRSRGLSPQGLKDYYRQRSLLKVQVLAEHVGNAVVFFASEKTPTTGASLPVDGGIPAAFPR